jgi:uncharacterized protein (TIGR03435 family)
MNRAFGIAALVSTAAFAQTTTTPKFEVATIKRNTSNDRSSGSSKNGRTTWVNIPLTVIIARAYRVSNDRVVGPEWLKTDCYDISATYPPDTSGDDYWMMLRNLIEERFKLTVRRDNTPVTVYALIIAKDGPKFTESPPDAQYKEECRFDGPKLTCVNQKVTMERLAQDLPRWLTMNWFDAPIADLTGLKGTYNFTLTWTPTDRPPDAEVAGPVTNDPSPMFLFDALQNQLGLKIERRKAPIERIVIDHIERNPIEN